ncbi:hypothetical protein Poly51_45020 [Rubripirellula tenax]|uniref:Uncharacterized protein n=1 Tax=Rubripirellula tenax TaxID=2528015 RepID=A0A5C6ELW8_9BACT|nr:hypothetical protein [Rubripirellula tenax]TWU48601.1 hypothetical protein Poly51_45020 [Rubripirellula tenax]
MFFFIDPFAILLALVPLIGYLMIFSFIRLSGRALVTTGARDIAALAVGISGLLAVGPAELFFPSTAATLFGPVVWLALIAFYLLVVALITLTSRPKLVVFGRSPEDVYPALARACKRIDDSSVGDDRALQIRLPKLGIHVRVDGQRGMDYTRVMTFEPIGDPRFWQMLLGNLRFEVKQDVVATPRRGLGMLAVAVLLAGVLMWQGFGNQELVVEGFRDWLWR